jgi:hypothetical protein
MTQMIEVYTGASTATSAPRADPVQDVQHMFPWTATSIEGADQAWFWKPDWQAGEREAAAEIAAGRTTRFDSDEDFLAALEREMW